MIEHFPSEFRIDFGEREFILQPMSVITLRDNLNAIASEIVMVDPEISISEDCRYLRICNPNVTADELIAIAKDVNTLDDAYRLLAFHYKLPFQNAVALLTWGERIDFAALANSAETTIDAEDFESLIDTYDDGVRYGWEYGRFRSGWDSEELLPLFLARNEDISKIWQEVAPELFEWFTRLDTENLLEYVMSISYQFGGIGGDIWKEHNPDILLTEFVRQKRNGYLQNPEKFHFANWNKVVDEEFESYIYNAKDLGFGKEYSESYYELIDIDSDFSLGSALHLPDVFLEEIPNEAMFSVEGGNIFMTTLINDDTYVDWEIPENASSTKLVGIVVSKGDGDYPVLPLYNVFGDLEMIMVCLDYAGESIDMVIDMYLTPSMNRLENLYIPYYVGNMECNGQLIIGDAVWTEYDKTLPSIQVKDIPIDEYGLVIFFDNSSFEATAICAVRGTIKRKFELLSAVFPEIKESSLKDGFATLLEVKQTK